MIYFHEWVQYEHGLHKSYCNYSNKQNYICYNMNLIANYYQVFVFMTFNKNKT